VANDTIDVRFSPLPLLKLPKEVALCRGGVAAVVPDALYIDHFLWNDGNRTAQHTFATTGSYTLQASNGCGSLSASVEVKDAGICSLHFPNAFTPNRDGKNDLFRSAVFTGIENYFLSIYNRWGQVIFHTADPSLGWDGTAAGKAAPTGTYVWRAGFKDIITGTMKYESGAVMLLR
jgi:gliding motility-associated-like protein